MRKCRSVLSRSSFWPIVLFVLSAQAVPASTSGVSIEKTFIGRQPDNAYIYLDSLVNSPDRRHIAYVAVSEDGMRVGVDNSVGDKYHHIAKGYPIFSPVGNRIGFVAEREGKHYVVIDGKEYAGYDGACCLQFSPNGKYTAYITQDKDKQLVMLNGRRMKPYDMIDRIIGVQFSPDSKTVAYVAKNNSDNSVRLIVNGKESTSFDSITEILFSPDSKTTAYIVSKDKEQFVIRGAIKYGPYDKAEGLIWSSDSARLAFMAIKNGKFVAIKNGQENLAGDFSPQTFFYKEGGYATRVQQITPPVFSPDASLMAFTRTEEKKYQIIIGETTGPLFDLLSPVVFSPDSKHYAYIGATQTANGMKMQIVHDQTRSPFYDEADIPVFSPDSVHLAYRVRTNDKWFMIVDGKKQKSYDAVGAPYFSPDSRILAYNAIKGNNILMVVNGKEESYPVDNPRFSPNIITRPCFSPDSRHIAYLVQTKRSQCALAINGIVIQTFDAVFLKTLDMPIVFDAENKARFMAAFLKNERFEAFQINIIIDSQE